MALSEYIRRRKLCRAADDLLQTNEKIIDIALKYGYESADAFSVAFKRAYNISPSFAKQNHVSIEPFHRLYFSLSIKYIKGDAIMRKITNIRPLLDGIIGHNYGLPDCIKFMLEHLGSGEKLDFWDIAAITGDTVAQVYNHNPTTGSEYCVSGYLAGPEYIQYVFDTLGYGHEYITAKQLNADNNRYIRRIVEMIDRDIPVLVKTNLYDIPEWHSDVGTYCLIVGYDHGGQIIKLLFDGTETVDFILTGENKMNLIFIGEKQREVTLEELYIKAIQKMTHWLTLPEHDGLFYGAAAFRAWANDIETGRFADDSLPLWENYGVYVSNLATSPAIPFFIFKKLSQMNPAFSNYMELHDEIKKLFPSFKPDDITPDESKDGLWSELEHIGGGMNMDVVRITMNDKEKRSKVAAVFRDYAERLDQTVELLNANLR